MVRVHKLHFDLRSLGIGGQFQSRTKQREDQFSFAKATEDKKFFDILEEDIYYIEKS